jgi:hypothetical protein
MAKFLSVWEIHPSDRTIGPPPTQVYRVRQRLEKEQTVPPNRRRLGRGNDAGGVKFSAYTMSVTGDPAGRPAAPHAVRTADCPPAGKSPALVHLPLTV